jgi:DNA-binding transcriptional ArsR family regulator
MLAAQQTDQIFAALGSTTRRALLALMVEEGEAPVQALADHFAISRPSVSEHLKVLKDAGIVAERREGRQRLYRVEPEPLLAVRGWFDTYEEFWRNRMGALRKVLDEENMND